MYHHFYELSESPFALTPDPKYLFLSPSHKEALASMIYGVQERKGFVLILGEVGTGKTTLVRHVLGLADSTIKTAFVFNTAVNFKELLHMMLRDLEVPCQSRQRLEMINALHEYLLKEEAAGRCVVLIVDEAQHLSPRVLEDLRMLSNVETVRSKLLQIILVGQPELGEKLGRPDLRQLRQRIGLVAQLKPLTFQETGQYIAHRLKVAGHPGGKVFTRRALKKLYRASGGIPRLINVICDKSLALGYGEDARQINGLIVKEVLKDWSVFGKDAVASPQLLRKRPVAILLSFVAALLLFLFASKPGGELRSRITVPDFLTQIGALNDFARLELEDREHPIRGNHREAQSVQPQGGHGPERRNERRQGARRARNAADPGI